MKVRWVKSGVGIGYGYLEGAESDMTKAQADELLELGYVVQLSTSTGNLPDDFPGRKILIENGFETIAEIKKLTADDLTSLKGIGTKLAESIINALSKIQ